MKRITSFLLALAMLVSMMPTSVLAAEVSASGECGAEGDSVLWTLDTDGIMTITGSGRIFGFPEEYKQQILTVVIEEGVTAIGASAFSGCSNLRSIIIPGSVQEIWNGAFQNCSSLTTIDIPNGVSTIFPTTFTYCTSLTSVTIPNSVTMIGGNAFFGCSSLETIAIPNGITEIGDEAFAGCALKSVTIPESVEDMSYAFHGCTTLSAIEVAYGNNDYCSMDGILYNAVGTTLITCPEGKSGSISIPEGVTTIDNTAFVRCAKLTDITLPSTITRIYPLAFSACSSLTEVIMNAGGSVLGDFIFDGCSVLNTLTFTSNAPSFNQSTFEGLTATAYYPADNATWTEDVRQNYGGAITWLVIGDGGSNGGGTTDSDGVDYISLLPANGATDVGTTVTDPPEVEITFNKDIVCEEVSQFSFAELDFTAGSLKIHKKSDDSVVYEVEQNSGVNSLYKIDGTYSFEAKVVDGNTLKIDFTNPHTVLEPGTEYYITVGAGFVEFTDDTACLAVEKGEWEFTTKELPFSTCYLDELTPIDYLAFSYIVYEHGAEELSVKDLVGDPNWNASWENTDIMNSELFAHISNWRVYDYEVNNDTGFAAYAFINNYNEVVISYRGSTSLLNLIDRDWHNDWLENDFNMYFGGKGAQVFDALDFAAPIIEKFGADLVHITGHSLGGGLCDIVSARYGCYSESFNAAPFLLIAYRFYPEQMGILFTGVSEYLFIDHITRTDFPVGAMGAWMKNAIIHEPSQYCDNPHLLPSLVCRQNDGILGLTSDREELLNDSISNWVAPMDASTRALMGTSKADDFLKMYYYDSNIIAYGGNSSDNILASLYNDLLVGGQGNSDYLNGGRGNDNYYYFKGDGIDYIYDISGNDTIYLCGFNSSDNISVDTDETFVCIMCNGEKIINIKKDRGWFSKLTIDINGQRNDISNMFKLRNVSDHVRIACPVNIEIVNSQSGEVVYTLSDNEDFLGAHYTDYGHFYVFEDETGEYVKVADLFDGYSVRIVGAGTGTMDVSVYEPTSDGLSDALQAKNVPVTTSLIATVEDIDGEKYLVIDADGDGSEDDRVQLTESGTIHTHSGGTAICTQKAICSGCGEAYGDYAAHDYESAWSQGDASGHWHKCKNCNAHDTQVAHTPGAAATATTAQTCTVCGYVIKAATGSPATETTKPEEDDEPIKYKITSGKNKTWRKGSDYGLSITADAPQDDFVRVLVDGKVLSTAHYWISGDTIITLKLSYLEDLPRDKYTIRIEFDDGYAETTFTVASEVLAGMPFTGDNFNLAFWLGVNITSGLSLLAIFVVFLRKRYLYRQTQE